jgi:hypothetical protein
VPGLERAAKLEPALDRSGDRRDQDEGESEHARETTSVSPKSLEMSQNRHEVRSLLRAIGAASDRSG